MNLTPNEVLIIAMVALVVLGPQRLPEAARQIGKGYRELRKMSTSVRAEIDNAIKEPMESITSPINEITSTLKDTVAEASGQPRRSTPAPQAGADSSVPESQADDDTVDQTPDVPNSAYRPADELDVDDSTPETP